MRDLRSFIPRESRQRAKTETGSAKSEIASLSLSFSRVAIKYKNRRDPFLFSPPPFRFDSNNFVLIYQA